MSAYRDASPSMHARFAELWQRWHDDAARVPEAVRELVHERGGRLHGARAVLAVQSAFTLVLVWLVYRHAQEPAHVHGHFHVSPSALQAGVLVPIALVVLAVARAVGRLYGARAARRELARALDGPHTMETLANRSPLEAACGLARTLERPSVAWATASRGAVFALLVLGAAVGARADFYATYLAAIAVVVIQVAMVVEVCAWRTGMGLVVPLVAVAGVVLAAHAGVGAEVAVVLLVHVGYVSVRAWLLGRAVGKERAVLAAAAHSAGCAPTGR